MHIDRPGRTMVKPADSDLRVEARAERVLAEYLRQWGLRAPGAIAAQCQLWVRQVKEEQPETMRREDLFTSAALERATSDMQKWLDELALRLSFDPTPATARRGLLAMQLQKIIDLYPQALLQYESLPASFLEELRATAQPVVPPPTSPTQMQGPPLGELPPLLQPRRWRTLMSRLTAATLFVIGSKGGDDV